MQREDFQPGDLKTLTRPLHRVRGRAALERRARALMIAIERFGRGRALTHDDFAWAVRALAALSKVVSVVGIDVVSGDPVSTVTGSRVGDTGKAGSGSKPAIFWNRERVDVRA